MKLEHVHSFEAGCRPRDCVKCNQIKWSCEFYKNRKTECKTCSNKRSNDHRGNKLRTDPEYRDEFYSKMGDAQRERLSDSGKALERDLRKYGITVEDYFRKLKEQDGKCAVCKQFILIGEQTRLHIDHDHKTGAFRGLLCFYCNTLIGKANDDPAVLIEAAAYIMRNRNGGQSI